MNRDFPAYVLRAISELANEPTTRSIWLVGSQASGTAKQSSDWDLLVFSTEEPQERPRRHEELDVIHVGPSMYFLAEGQSADFTLSFANWEWKENGDHATYTGYDFPKETDSDGEPPSVIRSPRYAVQVWLAALE